jgi:hypothetical protein
LTTSWTLTRERICDKALEKCQRFGVGRTVSADDRALCLEALDGILKNLHVVRLLVAEDRLGVDHAGDRSGHADEHAAVRLLHRGDAEVRRLRAGRSSRCRRHAGEWAASLAKTTQAPYPDRCYIDNFNVLWLYPVPNAARGGEPVLPEGDQRHDRRATSPDLDSPWLIGLPMASRPKSVMSLG